MSLRAGILSPRILIHLFVMRPLLKLVFGISVEGEENLEGLSRFVLAANHNSHLDVLLLFSILPARQIATTHPVAAQEYFSRYRLLYRVVNYLFQPVWIRRGERVANPLAGMEARLDQGHNLIIFPEGTRGRPGEIRPFKSGVGRLAESFRDVPTVPVFLSGPERALPKASKVPIPMWNHVTIGPPHLAQTGHAELTKSLETMIRELAESRTASRHQRARRPRKAFTLAVLGIDGSGKSTVSRRIAEALSATGRASFVSDRLELFENGARKAMQPLASERARQALGRYAKTAKSLKHYKIPKLAELLLRDHLMDEVQRWYAPDLLVLDGSPLINMTAWAKIYKGEAFDINLCSRAMNVLSGRVTRLGKSDAVRKRLPELASLNRLGLARMHTPDAVIMLDVDPAVSVARIETRGEKRQVHETEEKLARLREGYLMVCKAVESEFGIPVRILDGNLSLEQVTTSALECAREIRREASPHGST